ncbi:cysteine-rich KTR domain-containing protein [Tissierella praeacuta]
MIFLKDCKKCVDENGWIYCPSCGAKTRTKIQPDTIAYRWPLYC